MLIKRTAIWLLAWGALVWLTGQALAQAPANSNLEYQTPTPSYENGSAPFSNANPDSRSFLPFNPVNFEPSLDMFGPAETSGYGNGPRPHIGYFASYERVYWSLSKPSFSVVGSETAPGPNTRGTLFQNPTPGPTPGSILPFLNFPAQNSADTGFMQANGAWGNRWELGYIDTDNYGWMASVLDHVSQGQFHRVNNAEVEFNDPNGLLTGFIPNVGQIPGLGGAVLPIGKMQTQFSQLDMKNITRLNGVELMRMYRPGRLHKGGYMDILYGVRYFQLEDTFSVNGLNTTSTTTTVGTGTALINPLSDSFWGTRIQNNLIGPQIGARWARQQGHWVTSFEARFLAAANLQNAHQKTNLGTNTVTNISMQTGTFVPLPLSFTGIGSDTHLFNTTFAPLGELRLQTTYQLTNNVGFKVGYTGLVMGGISRASNRIDYSGPNLISIKDGNFNQIFFSNGVNVGVEVNR
jgi:hypothetical protein